MDWGGWLRHRVLGILPNDADTVHGVQVFDVHSLVTVTSDTPRVKTKMGAWGTGDVVHA